MKELMILSKHKDAVPLNNNKKPPRKIEEIHQDFNSHFGKSDNTLIKKKCITEEIAHDTKKWKTIKALKIIGHQQHWAVTPPIQKSTSKW